MAEEFAGGFVTDERDVLQWLWESLNVKANLMQAWQNRNQLINKQKGANKTLQAQKYRQT